ncbi:protein tyrosine kinase domain-containing protein [Rhizoctonia solani AG-1 IA]|uniref:Protein tyrosine kinase domain-containing protein n=1 Tax=Thanatephorus cucumeris (strain AG1-IA) TaxID=983506 RepID=L8WRV7_THACA|nr:protein tyrosine kinase domain-containing protein [Rhizoctonia solani AG-1 IA]
MVVYLYIERWGNNFRHFLPPSVWLILRQCIGYVANPLPLPKPVVLHGHPRLFLIPPHHHTQAMVALYPRILLVEGYQLSKSTRQAPSRFQPNRLVPVRHLHPTSLLPRTKLGPVAEIAPVPCIGSLVGCLTAVFQAVERTRVNKDQWKLLQGRCVMVMRIAGAQVMNNGHHHYPGLEEAAKLLEETLNKIEERAQHYNQMNEYATDIAQSQWISEFRAVQKQESQQLEHLKNELGRMDMKIDTIGRSSEQILQNTSKVVDILQAPATTTAATFDDAQRIVRTILAVTKLQLPPKLLLGRQCIPDTNIPIKTGITCDVYLASFLVGEKVAKKVFRIGMSDKAYVQKYATRFLRIASLWSDLRSDYTLPFYGIGMESFDANTTELTTNDRYMVSPLMKNFDAMTYLSKYRNNAGMKKNILRIITDAAKGLQYLHNRSPPVVHSGMRGDNVLITDSGGAVLGGFGLTKALESVENTSLPPAVMTGRTESQRWLAPEMFEDDPPAMAALEIVSGSIPYHMHKQAMNIILKVNQGPPRRRDHPGFDIYAYRPDEMWTLLERCWAKEPENRPSMDEVVAELKKIGGMEERRA